jgi:hypothetical protein
VSAGGVLTRLIGLVGLLAGISEFQEIGDYPRYQADYIYGNQLISGVAINFFSPPD